MVIEIPENIIDKNNLTEKEIKIELALFLFSKNMMTLDQASNFANIDSHEFQMKLGENKIPIHYSEEDLNSDLNTIKKMFE